jgi:glutathione S-transferase
MMKLYWSSRSPYVRKVMIVAHELGVANEIETVRTLVHAGEPNRDYMAVNPLSKIPTLVAGDLVLHDSVVICDYLDETYGSGRLIPREGQPRWTALVRQSLADGIIDTAILWRLERTREPGTQSEALLAACPAKIGAALDVLEGDAGFPALTVTIGEIAVASALSYLDFRFADEPWREGRRPRLAAWFGEFSKRPSMTATVLVDK